MAYSHGGFIQWGKEGSWASQPNGKWIGKTTFHNNDYAVYIKIYTSDTWFIFAYPLVDSAKGHSLTYKINCTLYGKNGNIKETINRRGIEI